MDHAQIKQSGKELKSFYDLFGDCFGRGGLQRNRRSCVHEVFCHQRLNINVANNRGSVCP